MSTDVRREKEKTHNCVRSILNELDYVKGRQNRGRIRRHLGATEDENNVLACYRRIRGHLERLSVRSQPLFFDGITALMVF